jgi:hypothetical protein
MTSHELARKMLEGPDIPVAVGQDVGVYYAGVSMFRVHPSGKRLLFDRDRTVRGEVQKEFFWISGPLI